MQNSSGQRNISYRNTQRNVLPKFIERFVWRHHAEETETSVELSFATKA